MNQDEFDHWYTEAVRQGFCLDIPKNYLSQQGKELVVKVVDPSNADGYIPMLWQEARLEMETCTH